MQDSLPNPVFAGHCNLTSSLLPSPCQWPSPSLNRRHFLSKDRTILPTPSALVFCTRNSLWIPATVFSFLKSHTIPLAIPYPPGCPSMLWPCRKRMPTSALGAGLRLCLCFVFFSFCSQLVFRLLDKRCHPRVWSFVSHWVSDHGSERFTLAK